MTEDPVDADPEAASSRIDRLRAGIALLGDRVEDAADHVPAVDAALQFRSHDQLVAGNLLASAVAYRLFLWILPLSLVLASVLGFLHAASEHDPRELAADLGLSAYVASSVANAAQQAERSRWLLLFVGLIALYSASASAARTMVTVYALVWAVPVPKAKSSWKRAVGFVGFAMVVIALVAVTHVIQNGAVDRVVLSELLSLVVIAFVGLAMSWLLPHDEVPWIRLLPGTAVMAVGVVALRVVTALYIVGKIQTSSNLYGGLGAAAVILLWLYLIGRMAVGAAVLNATLWRRHRATLGG